MMNKENTIKKNIKTFGVQVEEYSLNSIVTGLSFAAALAWMDVVRALLSSVVKVQKNGNMHFILTAVLTTLLSVLVYMVLSRISKRVRKPQETVYAVTA
tara:strand:+ start:1306 stop:1602 length:297 start_codon:yes stop_codon:yes gene_type:complete